jgi:hypothetical protein
MGGDVSATIGADSSGARSAAGKAGMGKDSVVDTSPESAPDALFLISAVSFTETSVAAGFGR